MPKQKTILHVIRHGEVDNPATLRYGRLPGYHLSTRGRQMVEAHVPFLTSRNIQHIYASPLERTQQTATIIGIALPEVPISLDPRLIEVKTAKKFEGKSRDLGFYIPDEPTQDAESKDDIINRLAGFCEEKVIQHNGQEVVVVSHGDPIALFYNFMTFGHMSTNVQPYPKYASVFSFVYAGLTLQSTWYRD
jgi:broad specificity phosphatase PhoE